MIPFSAKEPYSFDDSDSQEINGKKNISKSHFFKMSPEKCPLDESEEFHNPFSDLSLFLAKKIKSEISRGMTPQKWSQQIQIYLIKMIVPELKKHFPKYQIGNNALKKTWEKVVYYLQILKREKKAFRLDGTLNLSFLIQQNLKQFLSNTHFFENHPHATAYNLAIKISECIAVLDGTKIDIAKMTKTIWSIQKHLIPKSHSMHSTQFEKYDLLDKLLVRLQLEESVKEPNIPSRQLKKNLQKRIENIRQIQQLSKQENLTLIISCFLARTLFPQLKIHAHLPKEKIQEIQNFVSQQITEHKNFFQDHKDLIQIVHKISFLCKLSTHLSISSGEKNLALALQYIYNLSTNKGYKPLDLFPEIYAFIQAEINFIKEKHKDNPLEHVLSALMQCFAQAAKLPKIKEHLQEEVQIIAWNTIYDEISTSNKFLFFLKEEILRMLANIHIENPKHSFSALVTLTLGYFKKWQSLPLTESEKKFDYWINQQDLVYQCLHFDEGNTFIKIIQKLWKQQKSKQLMHSAFIEKIIFEYLKLYPHLAIWKEEIKHRATIMYKFFWYKIISSAKESSYDRLLKWYIHELTAQKTALDTEHHKKHIKQIMQTLTPIIPFSEEYFNKIFLLTNQEKKTKKNHRQAQ